MVNCLHLLKSQKSQSNLPLTARWAALGLTDLAYQFSSLNYQLGVPITQEIEMPGKETHFFIF